MKKIIIIGIVLYGVDIGCVHWCKCAQEGSSLHWIQRVSDLFELETWSFCLCWKHLVFLKNAGNAEVSLASLKVITLLPKFSLLSHYWHLLSLIWPMANSANVIELHHHYCCQCHHHHYLASLMYITLGNMNYTSEFILAYILVYFPH